MGKSFKRMFQQRRTVRWTTLFSILFLSGTWLLPVYRIVPLMHETPFIALHYNIYLGVDRFGPAWHIFFIPLLGTCILLLNVLVEAYFYRQQKVLTMFFAVATPILQFILLISMVLIVLINL